MKATQMDTKGVGTIPKVPEFDGGLKGWTINYIGKRGWSTGLEVDDLIQEAFLCYWKVKGRYGDSVQNAKHFMSLYKTTFSRHVTDLANKRTRDRSGEDGYAYDINYMLPSETLVLLQQAPPELQVLAGKLMNPPPVRSKPSLDGPPIRETRAQYYHRLSGADDKVDIMRLINATFAV